METENDKTVDKIMRQMWVCEYHHKTGEWPDPRDVAELVIKKPKDEGKKTE